MKNLCKVLGIAALVAVIGFSVAGCKTEEEDTPPYLPPFSPPGVELPLVYQNTTWLNTEFDEYSDPHYFSKIAFATTSATIYKDNGAITDLVGTVYNVKSVGPNNYYTQQLGVAMLQVYLEKPQPPTYGPGGEPVAVPQVAVYIFVKDDGTGLFIQKLGGGGGGGNITEQEWAKQP